MTSQSLIVTGIPWIDWAFQRSNETLIAGWGFWLAVLGLFLTLIGFGATIYQLRKTRSAATAAKEESLRIQRALARYEVVNEATRAAAALATARKFLRSGLWSHVADSYETVRIGLAALKTDASDLLEGHVERIDVACKYIQKLCAKIERDIQNDEITVNAAKTVSVMAEHTVLIYDITRTIEKGVINDTQR